MDVPVLVERYQFSKALTSLPLGGGSIPVQFYEVSVPTNPQTNKIVFVLSIISKDISVWCLRHSILYEVLHHPGIWVRNMLFGDHIWQRKMTADRHKFSDLASTAVYVVSLTLVAIPRYSIPRSIT